VIRKGFRSGDDRSETVDGAEDSVEVDLKPSRTNFNDTDTRRWRQEPVADRVMECVASVGTPVLRSNSRRCFLSTSSFGVAVRPTSNESKYSKIPGTCDTPTGAPVNHPQIEMADAERRVRSPRYSSILATIV
jgi:hypothetical protein